MPIAHIYDPYYPRGSHLTRDLAPGIVCRTSATDAMTAGCGLVDLGIR